MKNISRRDFIGLLTGALGATTVGCGSGSLQHRLLAPAMKAGLTSTSEPPAGPTAEPNTLSFPDGFLWGASTSAYQIEGGWNADGRGESVWDRAVHTNPGLIVGEATGDITCDDYHFYQQDVALARSLDLKSYRFSISWSRVLPSGYGSANESGIDFYSRLTDDLLAAGIRPVATLNHFDLPQGVSDLGGWAVRDTAQYFADYAALMVRTLGDRITTWLIMNEPFWFTLLGYWTGSYPPFLSGDFGRFMRTTNIANIAQGQAFQAMKATKPALKISSAFSITPITALSDSSQDQDAAARVHAFLNAWFLDPPLKGSYPDAFRPFPEADVDLRSGDMELMRAPFDFLGINSYSRGFAWQASPGIWNLPNFEVGYGGGSGSDRTDAGWEVWPNAIHDALMRMHTDYALPLEVTENGGAYNDAPDARGVVNDQRRIDYYKGYIAAVLQAIQQGADVRSYHAWSLLDNFEWLEGFSQRYGLVYVDFSSPARTRTVKNSGKWYAQLAATNSLV